MLYETTDKENLSLKYNKIADEIKDDIKLQKQKRETLHECLKKVSEYTDNLKDVPNLQDLFLIFENLKKALDYESENINLLKNFEEKNNKIYEELKEEKKVNIEEFNIERESINKKIKENNLIIEKFFREYVQYCSFDIQKNDKLNNIEKELAKVEYDSENISNLDEKSSDSTESTENAFEKEQNSSTETITNEVKKDDITDNRCLIISEMKDKVFLPYTIDEVEQIYEKEKNKYQSFQEIIDDKFTMPLSKYKNPALARFREAFSLMKYKEKESLSRCLDLALELMFNRLLNPAVITACKNLDELDIYLDYLSTNELNKFTIFDVKYEIAPMNI